MLLIVQCFQNLQNRRVYKYFYFFPEMEIGELFFCWIIYNKPVLTLICVHFSLVNKILFGEFDDRVGFECH